MKKPKYNLWWIHCGNHCAHREPPVSFSRSLCEKFLVRMVSAHEIHR